MTSLSAARSRQKTSALGLEAGKRACLTRKYRADAVVRNAAHGHGERAIDRLDLSKGELPAGLDKSTFGAVLMPARHRRVYLCAEKRNGRARRHVSSWPAPGL